MTTRRCTVNFAFPALKRLIALGVFLAMTSFARAVPATSKSNWTGDYCGTIWPTSTAAWDDSSWRFWGSDELYLPMTYDLLDDSVTVKKTGPNASRRLQRRGLLRIFRIERGGQGGPDRIAEVAKQHSGLDIWPSKKSHSRLSLANEKSLVPLTPRQTIFLGHPRYAETIYNQVSRILEHAHETSPSRLDWTLLR